MRQSIQRLAVMKNVSSMSGIGSRPWRKTPCVVMATSAAYLPESAPNMSRPAPKMTSAVAHAAAAHHGRGVDDPVGDAGRVPMGIREGRLVLDGARIEDREIGGVALAHEPSILQPQARGGHARHLVHRGLQREEPLLARILA